LKFNEPDQWTHKPLVVGSTPTLGKHKNLLLSRFLCFYTHPLPARAQPEKIRAEKLWFNELVYHYQTI
jgi:hypothetical protein